MTFAPQIFRNFLGIIQIKMPCGAVQEIFGENNSATQEEYFKRRENFLGARPPVIEI